jgi:DNA polymerase-3 subunit epsilon
MAVKIDTREVIAALLPAVLLVAAAALVASVVALAPDTEGRIALGLFALGLLAAVAGTLLRRAYVSWVQAAARLTEDATTLLAADVQRVLDVQGAREISALAGVINQFATQRGALRADVAAQVAEASRSVEQERARLAALMAELTQSVVVCNLDGRILLYNRRARLQLRALSAAPTAAGGAELIGLGRSIYALLDRALIAHAIESVRERLARGAAHPSAQFVTGTRAGALLRVQMAPVRPAGDAAVDALDGFVLMLDNITRDFAAEAERDRLLHMLGEGSRAALGNVQAALEMLEYPDLDAATRERFMHVVRDEVRTMSARVQELATHSAQTMKTRWPLEDMRADDLVAAACRRIEAACGCRAAADNVDPTLWLQVDSYSLLQALTSLAARLAGDYDVKLVRLRAARADKEGAAGRAGPPQASLSPSGGGPGAARSSGLKGHARLDLVWQGPSMSTETVIGWETEPMRIGAQSVSLTVRDVIQRHEGEFWFERERVRHESFFRMLLPLAAEGEPLEAASVLKGESRPEVYDFDLFRATDQTRELAQRSLAELSFTVFDTETTGLDPSSGDEILQIGAMRIVAGKLRRDEGYEQLVNPQRDIPAVGLAIHGIHSEMVADAPTIDAVLPTFHAYAQDTVLVAHNAAFDMRFLELKRERTGVAFEQPVLDTLLLSAVVHPAQASHRLEAIAERLGVPILGRHTAMGDAMVTAEVFLKLMPLLAERGIHTLGQALEASQQTYLARVQY